MALLYLHTTPVNKNLPSWMKMLIGPKAKSNLPKSIRNNPPDKDSIHQELQQCQTTKAANHNSQAGAELPDLLLGQQV